MIRYKTSYPIPVIRKAVINAIVHRDYTIEGAKIQLDVLPDRIIVKSPGMPVYPITIEALKNFMATSYSRNKKLAFIFNEMGYMEEVEWKHLNLFAKNTNFLYQL